MSDRYDRNALCALSDALADAADVHRAAEKTADDAALSHDLSAQAHGLRQMSASLRDGLDGDEPGSMLRLTEQVRLAVDSWFGNDDAAAEAAASRARDNLAALIDEYLRGSELSAELRELFVDIRGRVSGPGTPGSDDTGLKSLAR